MDGDGQLPPLAAAAQPDEHQRQLDQPQPPAEPAVEGEMDAAAATSSAETPEKVADPAASDEYIYLDPQDMYVSATTKIRACYQRP